MEGIKLDSGVLEDLEFDLLPLIEKRFNIKFEKNELAGVSCIEDLISCIIAKLDFKDDNLCTSQIAFYNLRNSLTETNLYNSRELSSSTPLCDIFSRKKNRIRDVRKLEEKLGYKIHILAPARILVLSLIAVFFISMIILFFNLIVGISGIIISSSLIRMAYKTGKQFKYRNIRDLIGGTICENYLSYRNNRNSINKKELRSVLLDWLSDNLCIQKEELETSRF